MSAMKAFSIARPKWITGVLLAAAAASPARATALSWNNAGGGSAATAGNWSPAQIPGSVDDLTFNLNNTYAVTFNSSVAASRTQTFRQGTVTLSMTSAHTTSNGVAIGDLAGDVSVVTLTTGSWSSGNSGFVNIGDAAGSTGTLNVNDDDADFFVTGTSDLFVGNNGTGTLNITGGGTATLADTMHVGQGSAATGNLTVSGFVAQAPFPISRLDVNGSGESRWGNGGDATVNVSNGALAHFAGDLVIGNLSTSTTTVSVQGPGLIVGATIDVDGDLLVGRNTSAGTAAGAATLNANADGRVVVGGTTFIAGDPDGGSATLHVATDGLITTGSLNIGLGTTLDLDGGEIEVNGGTLVYSNNILPLNIGGTQHPVLTMINNATGNLPLLSGGRSLVVGGGSGVTLGDFDVRSGSDLTISGAGEVMLGDFADDDGSMIINGAGSTMTLQTGSDLFVGRLGDGRFEAELEGSVDGQRMFIASEVGSSGLALFENPGTTAQFTEIYVGGDAAAAGGAGELVVNADAVLDVPGIIRIWETGFMEVAQGAVVNANSSIVVRGALELENGAEIHAGHMTVTGDVTGPNDIPGAATVDSSMDILSGATLTLIAGDLAVGDPDDSVGFNAQDGSVVTVGPHTLTVHDQNRAVFDTVTINGGQIIAPNGMEVFTPGTNGTLDGTGTITTSELFIESGGSVITATTPSGITINGKFRNNSGMIDGTKYTFNNNPDINDSGWTGAGTINAQVVFNSGTEINALANMTMGDGSNFGVTFNVGSELHADTRTVTLLDGNGVGLPSVTDLNGGHVVCAQPLVVNNGRRLSGRGGSVDCPTLTIFGRLSPGELTGVPVGETGELTINADLTLGVNSNTDIEIQGLLGPAEYDRVVVNGTATLDGDLNISIINGFNPPLGSVWTIMEYDSKVGDFANINITPGPTCIFVAVSDNAIVVSRGLPADLDHDGDVDISDLALLLSNFGCLGGVEFPCPIDLDFNGDTDLTDLAILLSSFGQACN